MIDKDILEVNDTCWVFDTINEKIHTVTVQGVKNNLVYVTSDDGFAGEFMYERGKHFAAPTFANETEIFLTTDINRALTVLNYVGPTIGWWDKKKGYQMAKELI